MSAAFCSFCVHVAHTRIPSHPSLVRGLTTYRIPLFIPCAICPPLPPSPLPPPPPPPLFPVVVPVVVLSEDRGLCVQLNKKGVRSETIKRVERDHDNPVRVLPASYLTKIYKQLGKWTLFNPLPPKIYKQLGKWTLYQPRYTSS